jgi:succinate-acetate transporter protein
MTTHNPDLPGNASVPGGTMTEPGLPLPRESVSPGSRLADPAPLGLAGFALTTMVLSFVNTGLFNAKDVGAVLGLALAYGGLVQLLAGMWEFARGNTFGAVAFSSYGGFWISYWWFVEHDLAKGVDAPGVGLYLICWAVFTGYMTIAATRVRGAVLSVFVLLTATYIVLGIAEFAGSAGLGKVGGWVGVATAAAAWYASFAGVTAFTHKRALVPTLPLS